MEALPNPSYTNLEQMRSDLAEDERRRVTQIRFPLLFLFARNNQASKRLSPYPKSSMRKHR